MRLAPTTDTVPQPVNRQLLPQERQVISVRRHVVVLLVPSGLAVAGLVAAAIVSGVSSLSGDALLLVWLVWALLALYAIVRVLAYFVEYYVVTSYRFLHIKGFYGRDVAMMPLAQATGMTFRRSAMGKFFGYGQLILDPRGQDQAMRSLNFVPYPEQIYLEVCGLLFPDRDYEPEQPARTDDAPDAPFWEGWTPPSPPSA